MFATIMSARKERDAIEVLASFKDDDRSSELHLKFKYHGGAYVEVMPDFKVREAKVVDVINVYDYAAGKPRIAFTERAVMDRIMNWGDDRTTDDVQKLIDEACTPTRLSDYR